MISYDKSIEAAQRYFPKEVIIANVRSYEENMLKKYNPEELASPEMPPVFVFETDDRENITGARPDQNDGKSHKQRSRLRRIFEIRRENGCF